MPKSRLPQSLVDPKFAAFINFLIQSDNNLDIKNFDNKDA